jgi:hypothetical protein
VSSSYTNWGGGHVTDLPYLPGYYRHQSPLHLHIACLLGGLEEVVLGLFVGSRNLPGKSRCRAGIRNVAFSVRLSPHLCGGRSVCETLLPCPICRVRRNPSELVGILLGTDQALLVLAPAAEPDPWVARFNAAGRKSLCSGWKPQHWHGPRCFRHRCPTALPDA